MLLVNIHELNIILAETVGLSTLEHQVDSIRRVFGLQRQDVFILGSAQNLGQRDQVDTEGNVTVAAVWRETLSTEQHGDEGNVRVVHGLEGDTGVIAVEVAVLNEVLDGVDDLREFREYRDLRGDRQGRYSRASGGQPVPIVPQALFQEVNWASPTTVGDGFYATYC